MSIKQKLLLMGAVMAILVGVICAVGYHRAQSALVESTSNEIDAALNVEAASLNGWLQICSPPWRAVPWNMTAVS